MTILAFGPDGSWGTGTAIALDLTTMSIGFSRGLSNGCSLAELS